MEDIVKIYNIGREKVAENYAASLVEREECIREVERGVAGARKDLKKIDKKSSDALRMLSAINAIHEIWDGVPIVRDELIMENFILYSPFGSDAPNRSIIMTPSTEDNENHPYYVYGNDGVGVRTFFATVSVNLHNAMIMSRKWIVMGKFPGEA